MDSLEKQQPLRSAGRGTRASTDDYRVTLLDDLKIGSREWTSAAIGTGLVHLLLITGLVLVPQDLHENETRERPHRITPLIDPPTRLTQKTPNKTTPTKEIALGATPPAPKLVQPRVETARKEVAPRKQFEAPPPAQVTAKNVTPPAIAQEPPKMVPQPQQSAQLTPPANVAPPLPRTVEAPKLMLESVPPPPSGPKPNAQLKVPSGGVQEAIQALAKNGGASSRAVGDDTDSVSVPSHSPNSLPSPTRPKSKVELLSDAKGVDFREYLLQVLQNVRRNWFTVMPESAHLGIRGRVVAQFSIAPDGKILKVVLTSESNAQQLDRAAVAALSMSNPLPQLPPEFKGDRIVLQFTFLYNAPR